MFYSQFILAKKGPLGTIWIAAHLERKLRKNQVADTDIGFSVDSILSPDVPIALRLSSHLLVGVVRIYSRKVNYLFDDCSEALLKIKQAFRSTAVDLPPEESTAPYNSITLPETFDLDDFELPDNDILQGNYVDHHISSKEQITLQDSMEGVVYTTSQFGLDERFGDGDTSQVGLDLEESDVAQDLFLDKAAASRTNGISELDHRMSINAAEDPKRDENDHRAARLSESFPVNYSGDEIGDRTSNAELMEYAQAPSTPVLVEEPNLSSAQHGLVCDDHLESEDRNSADIHGVESTKNFYSKTDLQHRDEAIDSSVGDRIQFLDAEQDIFVVSDSTINDANVEGAVCSTPVSMEYIHEDGTTCELQDASKVDKKIEDVVGVEEQPFGARLLESGNADVSRNTEGQSLETFYASELPPEHGHSNIGTQGDVSLNINIDGKNMSSSPSMDGLQTCNSNRNDSIVQPDIRSVPSSGDPSKTEHVPCLLGNSTDMQGVESHLVNSTMLENAQDVEPGFEGKIMNGSLRPDDNLVNEIPKSVHSEKLNDLPVPEKMLSVQDKLLDGPDQFIGALTPVSEFVESPNRISVDNRVSGRKRSFTESTLNIGDMNSAELLGLSRSKRTQESIPDDDDLLTSILVGRKSSVLRLKPNPPAPEVKTAKQSRPTSRLSGLKRKVLMDETMVLHGDTIRQQLTNTEDIRRLRKKAPCTRIEILMLQRQHLEDQVFNESVLTGTVKELACLHNETLDLSSIRIIKHDPSSEIGLDVEHAATLINQYGDLENSTEPVECIAVDDEQPIWHHVLSEELQGEDQCLDASGAGSERQQEATGSVVDLETSGHNHFDRNPEMGIDDRNAEETDALNRSETSHVEHVCLHNSDNPAMPSVDSSLLCKSSCECASEETNALNQPSDKTDIQLTQDETRLKDMNDSKLSIEVEALGHTEDDTVTVGTELIPDMEECKDGPAIRIIVDQAGCDAPSALYMNTTLDTIGGMDLPLGNEQQALEVIENGEVRLGSEEEGDTTGLEHIVKDMSSINLQSAELRMDPVHSVDRDTDVNDVVSQEVDNQTTMDADCLAFKDQQDFADTAFANDTEFLNADDDEMEEEDNNGVPSAEDTPLLDNSGWSSRSRAVAKYLQTLFDGEEAAGQGRKVVSMENLLAGKTRKEASRMFFETLVLKTRDYIQVEQGKPFDNINLKPRLKLMKSDL